MKHVFLVPMVMSSESVAIDSIKSLGDGAEYKLVFCLPRQPLGFAISESVRLFGFDPDTFVTIVHSGDEIDRNYLRCCEEVLLSHPECNCIVGRVKPVSTPRPLVLEASGIRKARAEDVDFRSNPPITFQVGKNLILPTQATPQNLMKKWLKGRNPERLHLYLTPNAVIYRS